MRDRLDVIYKYFTCASTLYAPIWSETKHCCIRYLLIDKTLFNLDYLQYDYDLFQINMSNFSTHVLILGHHGTGMQISQPYFSIILKSKHLITQFTLLIVYCANLYI